jgi:hypothetical protein
VEPPDLVLREENETDGEPDDEEAGQNPQQECWFANRQPGQLGPVEEEPRATGRVPVTVVLDDLASDGFRRLESRLSVRVDVAHLATAIARAQLSSADHENSVPGSAGILDTSLLREGIAHSEAL